MISTQLGTPGHIHDGGLKCDTCGSLGESRCLTINSEATQEWLQPPIGCWVHFNEATLRVRCPDCQEIATVSDAGSQIANRLVICHP